jgi:O-antigen/teichoic acid export membrane protein
MVLARSFSPAVAGNYSLALRVLYFPITLLGQAISQVWFAEWVALRNDPEASRGKLEMGIGILLAISIPSFLILILHGPFLFSLLFGTKWVGAGQIARVLAVWFIFLFVSSPLSPLMVVHERLGLQLGLSTAETILRLGALYAGIRMGSATAAICGLALAGTLISIIYIGVLLHLSGSGFLRLWKHVWRQVLAGLTVLLAGVGIAQIPANATILRCLSLAMGFAFLAWSLVGSLRASRLIRA